jgi:hypothetical protein
MAAGGGTVSGAEIASEGGCSVMKQRVLTLLSAAILLTALRPAPEPSSSTCAYDKSAMMGLSHNEFDQNPNKGWRKIAVSGCEEVAADLIRDWRTVHDSQDVILFWHEGQLRAIVGQYQSAIALFELSRKTEAEDRGWGWNIYVDGSIAFLQGDRKALKKAKRALINLPKPADLDRLVDINGNPVEIEWPLNLPVLEGFLRCWGQSYRQAYACPAVAK